MSANGASRAGLWLSIGVSIVLLLGVIGSMFYVAFEVRANSVAIQALNVKLIATEENWRSAQLKITEQGLALNEIETQFCATDIVRNLMHAADMRIASLLWQKVYGEHMPTDNAYYPTICNRKVQ